MHCSQKNIFENYSFLYQRVHIVKRDLLVMILDDIKYLEQLAFHFQLEHSFYELLSILFDILNAILKTYICSNCHQ